MTGCDCHIHILDPAFPIRGGKPMAAGMTLADYRLLQPIFGTTRAVIVQSKAYGTDPACLLDALSKLGPDGRGIAVLDPEVDDSTLDRLNSAGICGLRFSLWNTADAVTNFNMLTQLAPRLAELGWHAQLHLHADQIATEAEYLRRLPCDLVFDHMGRLPPGPEAKKHPAFDLIRELACVGRAWIKLSGPYLNRRGPEQDDDWQVIGRTWIETIPDRLVWGSDWPHVTEGRYPPEAPAIRATLSTWCDGDETIETRILSDTPRTLYGFN